MGHGGLLREYIRQLFPAISTSSPHHKLALPIEADRARADSLPLSMGDSQDSCLILQVATRGFPRPINNGRFFQDAGLSPVR
jgi:hypothetical protein